MLRFSDFLNFETAAMSAKGRTVRWQPIFERKQPPMAEVEEPGFPALDRARKPFHR